MMIYLAILPQFMSPEGNAALSAILLSTAFMFWCAVVYSMLSVAIGRAGGMRILSDMRCRVIDGTAGGMTQLAAGFLGTAQR